MAIETSTIIDMIRDMIPLGIDKRDKDRPLISLRDIDKLVDKIIQVDEVLNNLELEYEGA